MTRSRAYSSVATMFVTDISGVRRPVGSSGCSFRCTRLLPAARVTSKMPSGGRRLREVLVDAPIDSDANITFSTICRFRSFYLIQTRPFAQNAIAVLRGGADALERGHSPCSARIPESARVTIAFTEAAYLLYKPTFNLRETRRAMAIQWGNAIRDSPRKPPGNLGRPVTASELDWRPGPSPGPSVRSKLYFRFPSASSGTRLTERRRSWQCWTGRIFG